MNIVKFGDVASRLNIHVDQATTTLEYYIGGEHINSCDFMVHKRAPIKGATIGYQFQFGFEKRDILFMTKNPHLRKASMVDFDGLCSIATFVIRSNDESVLLQDYLLLEMQSDRFWDYCEEHKSGGVNYFINWGTLSNYEFPLPSIDEQKVLAEKLWAAYEVKQSYLKMIDATDEILRSHYNELVGDTQTNVHDWPIKKLSELANYTIGLTYKPDDVKDDGTIVLRSGNIKNSSIDLDDIVRVNTNIKDSLYVKAGDILMCSRNGSAALVGKVAQIKQIKEPMTFGAFMTIISSPHTDYLFLFFESEDFRKQISGGKSSTMNQITQYMLDDIVVPFADEESRVRLSRILQQADKSKAELRKSVDAIDKVIKSLINENL